MYTTSGYIFKTRYLVHGIIVDSLVSLLRKDNGGKSCKK